MERVEFAAIRARAEMTFKEIGVYLGVTLRAAQRYEYGERKIPRQAADKMQTLKKKRKGRRV